MDMHAHSLVFILHSFLSAMSIAMNGWENNDGEREKHGRRRRGINFEVDVVNM